MNSKVNRKIISMLLSLCLISVMIFTDTTVALANNNEIDNYLSGLKVSKNTVELSGSTYYPNLINGKESGVTSRDVDTMIEITKAEKVKDDDYMNRATNNYFLPAYSDEMYPGAIMNTQDSIVQGNISFVSIGRGAGNYTIKAGTNNKSVAIKSGKSAKFSVDEANQSNINKVLTTSLADSNLSQDIRVAQVTSPEQTAAELGLSVSDVKKFLPDNWTDIHTGKKQVAVALIRQNVCNVELSDSLINPSILFSDSTSIDSIKARFTESNPTMIANKVEYGMATLVSAEVYTDTTFTPRASNAFADKPDLAGALKSYFSGTSSTMTERQKNSLSVAKMYSSHIGGDSSFWTVPEETSIDGIKETLPTKYYSTKIASNRLVPLNFNALTMGQNQEKVTWSTDAAKYSFSCVTGKKSGNIWAWEHVTGGNPTKNEIKRVYGVNLDSFNSGNKIEEVAYCDEDNTKRSRQSEQFPAYQCVFGAYLNVCPKRNETRCRCVDRVIQGAFYQGECEGDGNIGNNGKITGPVDMAYGVTAETTDYSEDSYFKLNNTSYSATDEGSVILWRLWDMNLNGKGLKYVDGNNLMEYSSRSIEGTKISSLKAIKKGFKITVKMQSERTTGYQIRYSKKSNMKKAKIVSLPNHRVLTKTVKKLKPKTKYYVQVRTVFEKTLQSPWSKVKSVKTK